MQGINDRLPRAASTRCSAPGHAVPWCTHIPHSGWPHHAGRGSALTVSASSLCSTLGFCSNVTFSSALFKGAFLTLSSLDCFSPALPSFPPNYYVIYISTSCVVCLLPRQCRHHANRTLCLVGFGLFYPPLPPQRLHQGLAHNRGSLQQ